MVRGSSVLWVFSLAYSCRLFFFPFPFTRIFPNTSLFWKTPPTGPLKKIMSLFFFFCGRYGPHTPKGCLQSPLSQNRAQSSGFLSFAVEDFPPFPPCVRADDSFPPDFTFPLLPGGKSYPLQKLCPPPPLLVVSLDKVAPPLSFSERRVPHRVDCDAPFSKLVSSSFSPCIQISDRRGFFFSPLSSKSSPLPFQLLQRMHGRSPPSSERESAHLGFSLLLNTAARWISSPLPSPTPAILGIPSSTF